MGAAGLWGGGGTEGEGEGTSIFSENIVTCYSLVMLHFQTVK